MKISKTSLILSSLFILILIISYFLYVSYSIHYGNNTCDDLSDLGEHQKLTYDYMKTGNYEVGDFIARNGHAALIIGIDDTTIYTAESLPPKLRVFTYERYNGIVNDRNLDYVVEMSDIYPNGDGYFKRMW